MEESPYNKGVLQGSNPEVFVHAPGREESRRLASALDRAQWQANRDVSANEEAQERVHHLSSLLQNLIESSTDAIFLKDREGRYIFGNAALAKLMKKEVTALEGKTDEELFPRSVAERFRADDTRILERGKVETFEERVEAASGTRFFLTTKGPLVVNGKVEGLFGIGRDVTERKQWVERLERIAFHDHLTGLPNRLRFSELMTDVLREAGETKEKLALLLLDIDDFIVINDSVGHRAGDEILAELAGRFQKGLLEGEFMGRFGGDEFMFCLRQSPDAPDLGKRVRQLMRLMDRPYTVGGQPFILTIGMGVAIFPEGGTDTDTLLQNADTALRQAKTEGRQSCCFFKRGMEVAAREHLRLLADMQAGLQRDEFQLFFQPRVELASRSWVGLEALIRWKHPRRGWVSPSAFLPLAHRSGMILDIGRMVLDKAARHLRDWIDRGLSPLPVAVNLSAREFQSPYLIEYLSGLMNSFAIPEGLLEIELTEDSAMQSIEETIANMQALRAMGIRVAIDDFGKGHSSLAYLSRLPIDFLKVDQSFVSVIHGQASPADEAILQSIIQLGQNCGLTVVAEGVEHSVQAQWLSQHGCHFAQGYLFAKPMPEDELSRQLKGQGRVWAG